MRPAELLERMRIRRNSGRGVATQTPTPPALSRDAQPNGDITGRRIAVPVNNGVGGAAIQSLQLLAEGRASSPSSASALR